jgi:hypothetical protein
MEKLNAFPIADLGIKLKLQGDLLYHEGPLLSHFVNEDNPNEHYFYKWVDSDAVCNRWLIFRISAEKLQLFFDEKINLLQLIKQNPFVYFLDLDNELITKNVLICQNSNILEDYLPSENSFFKEIQYEEYALLLKQQLENNAKKALNDSALFDIVLQELSTLKTNQKEQNNLLLRIQDSLAAK